MEIKINVVEEGEKKKKLTLNKVILTENLFLTTRAIAISSELF